MLFWDTKDTRIEYKEKSASYSIKIVQDTINVYNSKRMVLDEISKKYKIWSILVKNIKNEAPGSN